MIKVKNLTKIYKSKKKTICKALDNVSFNLPDKGLVFICGKSGSGKSTLLNLLAGLDEITSGEIIVNGNNYSTLKINEFDDIRRTEIGFVFQDFCLLDDFTIKENILISLDLLGKEDNISLNEILKQVDLEGYENRYPKELSGGQKQRVAIARALIKQPNIILADEPTGNLDSVTTIQILNLLKQQSKDKLVVIISHSMENAIEYGDRIIELSEGHIVKDLLKKDKEFKLIDGNVINIPYGNKLTEEQLKLINEKNSVEKCVIRQQDDIFIDTVQPQPSEEVKTINKNKSIKGKTLIKFTKGFTKKYYLGLIVNSIIVSLLVILMIITQTFATFDGRYLLDNGLQDCEEFILQKGYYPEASVSLDKHSLVSISDEEIQKFYDNGYEGKVYKLYSSNISIREDWHGNSHTIAYSNQLKFSPIDFYIDAGRGVLECDVQYLEKIFGGVDVLAGTLDNNQQGCQIIITDYFADCLMFYRGYSSYDEIINDEIIDMSLSAFNVKAIINTNYKEKYKSVIDKISMIDTVPFTERKVYIENLQKDKEFLEFYNIFNNYLAIGYYVDGDYYKALVNDTSITNGAWNRKLSVSYNGTKVYTTETGTTGRELDLTLKEGEIILYSALFEQIFGMPVESVDINQIIGTEIQMEQYLPYAVSYDDPASSKTYKIVGIIKNDSSHVRYSYEDFVDLYDIQVFPYALYFDDVESIAKAYNPINDEMFYLENPYLEGVYNILNVISVFNDFFVTITIAITILCILILVGFGRKSIKRRMYEIGVVRALGAKNKELYFVFLIQISSMLILVSIISYVLLIYLDNYINSLLINNIMIFAQNELIKDLAILEYSPFVITLNLLFVTLITVLCSLLLMITLRNIKPIKIIRRDDE